MDKSMSENEIIHYFSRKYNIDKEFFVKRYLVKELLKLCEKDKSIKFFTDSENGNWKNKTYIGSIYIKIIEAI